jgi:hypothetical protein
MRVKYFLFLIADDNSTRWGGLQVGGLQVVGDDLDRWGSTVFAIYVFYFLFLSKLRNAKYYTWTFMNFLLKIKTMRSLIFKWDAMPVVTTRCVVFF